MRFLPVLFSQQHRCHRYILLHRHVGKYVKMLEYHSHLQAGVRLYPFFIRQIHIVEINFAAAWNLRRFRQRSCVLFSRTGRADNGHHLVLAGSLPSPFNTWSLPKSFFRFST